MNISDYDLLILDCDGVIFDSNQFKSQAFRNVFNTYYPEMVDDFILFHESNNGLSRREKIIQFFKKASCKLPGDSLISEILKEYGKLCRENYKNCAFSCNAKQKIEIFSKSMPIYVASGSDQDELEDVFIFREITGFFKGIFGAPMKKEKIIKNKKQRRRRK